MVELNQQGSSSSSDGGSAPSVGGKASRSALFIVFLVVFVDLLGFGVVLPLLSIYGDTFVKKLLPDENTRWLRGTIIGLVMSVFSLMQFIGAPVWGRISDRVGRRPILLIGLAGSALFYLLFGYASDLSPETQAALALTLIFISRMGAGLAGATIATAQAVIADCTPPEKRKMGMALIGAAFGIGFTFGPLLGFASLTLFPNNPGITGYAAALLSLVAFVLGLILMPETRQFGSMAASRKWFNPSAIGKALRSPSIGPVILVFFLASLGFSSFEVTLAMVNQNSLHVENRHNFLLFSYVGFVLMLAQGFLYRRLAKKVTEPTFMLVGILLMGLGTLALGALTWSISHQEQIGKPYDFWSILPLQLLCLTICVVGFALLTPSAQALISRRTDQDHQGEVLGVNQSASALARILGPVMGLSLYMATSNHLLPYLVGGLLLLLMLPLIPRIRKETPDGKPF